MNRSAVFIISIIILPLMTLCLYPSFIESVKVSSYLATGGIKIGQPYSYQRDAIRGFLVTGQSNAGAGSGPSGYNPEEAPLFPNHLFMPEFFDSYGSSNQVENIDSARLLTPYSGLPNSALSPGGAIGAAIIAMDRTEGFSPIIRQSATSWEGSQPITSFFPSSKDHYNFSNAIAKVRAMRRVSKDYAPFILDAIFFIQGENAIPEQEQYLSEYIDNVVPKFSKEIGQVKVPHFFLRQVNFSSDAPRAWHNSSHLAQLSIARTRLGSGVTLTGPMYHMPLHDNIHSDNIGRMIGGDQDALAYHYVTNLNKNWHPLWPIDNGFTVVENKIFLEMSLPIDSDELLFDDDWVSAVPNKGFVYSDAQGSAYITDVEINGSQIIITLSESIDKSTKRNLSYAHYNSSNSDGWASGRGLLYAESRHRSSWSVIGFDMPYEYIRHYCVRFQVNL